MDNPKIRGYRPITTVAADLVNQNKILEELVLRQIDQHLREADSQEIDQRWVALARTKIQMGFMGLNRAVFKPERLDPATPDLEGFERNAEVLVETLLRS